MRSPLVHPKLNVRNINHWPSRCDLQTATTSTNPVGQKVPSGYANVAGMADIPCRIAPVSATNITDKEVRTESVQALYSLRELKLNGYYPLIQARVMLAHVDGVRYQIRGVEHDSEHFSTRLLVETING